MSPIAETAPELYWQDNVLRSSEASDDTVRLVHAYDGIESMKKLIEKADRTKVHVVHVELADEQNYVRPDFVKGPEYPALRYAYDHPESPKLPPDALRVKSDVDASYASEDAVSSSWLMSSFPQTLAADLSRVQI